MVFSSWKASLAAAEAIRRRQTLQTYAAPLGSHSTECDETFEDMKGFLKNFYNTFYLAGGEQQRQQLLQEHPEDLAKFHKQLVPGAVVEEEFWQRYFYRCDEKRIVAQMKLSTVLRENVETLVDTTIQSYKKKSPSQEQQTPPPSSTTKAMSKTNQHGGSPVLSKTKGGHQTENRTARKHTATKQQSTEPPNKHPAKTVYRPPPMRRNSRAEELLKKGPSSRPSPFVRPQRNAARDKQQQPPIAAFQKLEIAPSGKKRPPFPRSFYGMLVVVVVLLLCVFGIILVFFRTASGNRAVYNDSDLVVAHGSALGFADTKRNRIDEERNSNNMVGGWFGGGGRGEAFGGVASDDDGSGVQAMISSWMQNVDFSQFAAATETDPPVVEVQQPEKNGVVGFFQRRFGRKERSTAVSANTSPGVVVHQHIHHVVHHVVHETR